jgi:CMP-N-acetylneuraminic acid synthetase
MDILAIIPARSGSKSVAHKNIRLLLGKPLMAYSIEHALACRRISRVIVSTDSEQYAEVAKLYGAEVPFLRPAVISDDLSNDIEFFNHALEWLEKNEGYVPDICVQLRPTHPIRNSDDTDRMIEMLIADPEADSVRSLIINRNVIPYKMWIKKNGNLIEPLLTLEGIREPYNSPRQMLPTTWFQNASVDVIRTACILKKKSLSGDKILGYEMEGEYDIDYEEDFIKVEQAMLAKQIAAGEITGKKLCFDIDGVIATLVPGNDYSIADPDKRVVNLIKALFDKGNKILIYTARGTVTGIDWKETTERQLKEWGVPFNELYFGKPGADIFIDDKAINILELITKL